MRYFKYLFFLSVLMSPALAFPDDLGPAQISLIDGEVQVVIKDTTDWSPAAINLPLNEGDRVWVPEGGKAELHIDGGVFTRLDGNTGLDLLTITQDSAQLYLDRGHIYINNRRGGIRTIQVDTPHSSVRSYDNSIMMLDVSEDGVLEISVLKGYAYAESRAGAVRVSAGNTLTIRDENNAELAPIGSPDDWERWNRDRDRRLFAGSESTRYLPDELHDYASDLDDNGRWEYAPDYGYVWTPTMVVADWTPYSAGRWIWIRGHYVWISHDPWGWAPCHYGRWVYIISIGWCWVPPARGAVYWGPGYVGWIVTPTYVAWVPLAPGEIYYGYGYYGPSSVNITTVSTSQVVVNRTYVNARVNNSVVVVQRDGFGTGNRAPVKLRENPFLMTRQTVRNINDIAIVPPQVRPRQPIVIAPPEPRERLQQQQRPLEREHLRPEIPEKRPAAPPSVVRQLPEQKLPPERFRRIRPEEMKNERRLVREREASVFKTQPPENLPVRKLNEPKVIKRKQEQQRERKDQGERKLN